MGWDQGLDKAGVAYKLAAAKEDRIRVIAGPGTGKSYAMKRRVARLLEEKVSPDKVLAVTLPEWPQRTCIASSRSLAFRAARILRVKPCMRSPCASYRASTS